MDIPTLGTASLIRQLGAWRGAGVSDPVYRQLARAMKLLILDGRVRLGVRIPGERELAQALGVSRTTVGAAFAQLRDEGYLLSRQGSGSVTRLPAAAPAESYDLDEATGADGMINWTAAALPAPQSLWHAYEDALHQLPAWLSSIGYETLGLPRLRQAIADDYARRGCPTSPAQIMVTSGAQHGLALMLRLLAGPGDRIVIDHPTYHNAISAIQKSSCMAVPVGLPLSGWDVDAIHAAFRQTGPRFAYLIADFHVPTGRCMDAATRRALVEVASRTHTPLVIDETMADTGLDCTPPAPVAAHDRHAMVISLGSASKRFWGGLRIGWIRADEQTIAALGRIRATLDMATPVMDQLAATVLLAGSEEDAAQGSARMAAVGARRDRLIALLGQHMPHWRVPRPEGGLSLWVEMPRPESSALAAMAQSHDLRITPGPRFGIDGAFERFVRLPFTPPDDVLEVAVTRLAAADTRLRARMGRAPALTSVLDADRVI